MCRHHLKSLSRFTYTCTLHVYCTVYRQYPENCQSHTANFTTWYALTKAYIHRLTSRFIFSVLTIVKAFAWLHVTRNGSKENEKDLFNPLCTWLVFCSSILKMLIHVFANHAEYSTKEKTFILKLHFWTGKQRYKLTESLINIRIRSFILGTIHYLWLGVGWQNISSEEGVQLFIIVEKNLTCNDLPQGGSNNRFFAGTRQGLLVCRVKSESNSSLSQMFESLAV